MRPSRDLPAEEREAAEELVRLGGIAPAPLDFTKLGRDPKRLLSTIEVEVDYRRVSWITVGQLRVTSRDSYNHRGIWEVAAYLGDATDFEHDSAFIFKLELVGVEFTGVNYGMTSFIGWVRSDPESFRVPNADYNPYKNATKCKETTCDPKGHLIVPEGFYVPPMNVQLYKQVQGRKVEVHTGIRRKDGY